MPNENVNDKYKDALFKVIFGENPENALSLYNAINKTEYTNVEDLEIKTLRNTVYIGIKNDVSFLFNHDLNLYEHQSTYCPNMPLRGLGYFADLYKLLLGGGESSIEKMYDSRLLEIPAPKYYVFYNGRRTEDEQTELRLSGAYKGKGDVEVVAHMVNVNKGFSEDLKKHCKPMEEYSEFVASVRSYLEQDYSKEDAIRTAIDDCIRDGILADLLIKERDRVENILIRGITEEEREHLYEMQLEREHKEAYEEGNIEGEDRIIKMNDYLIKQGRIEDLIRATRDKEFRESIKAEIVEKTGKQI